LYSQTQFIFRNPRHLIAFSHTIPQTHLGHIRSLRLDFSKLSSVYVRESRHSIITFKTPLLQPMQESLRIIRLMRHLRSCYILFRISTDYLWLDPEVGAILKDLQEYHERIRGATYTQCRVHLLVYENFVGMELVHQSTERGLIEIEEDGLSEK
jgi:diadenosine tetraphosphatase ApaH/serine/threonine PP2A family protein phosphatase